MEKGKTFKAEISLENQKGWFIQKVLSIEYLSSLPFGY
jgi:hypothetical protein